MQDFDPDRLSQLLAGQRWGQSLQVLKTTASTMDDALKAAQAGAPDGHVVLADHQTRGRGAHGRQWSSPAGTDVYFSVIARPTVEVASTAVVTLAVGLGVCDAVSSWVPDRNTAVKWPNDVWIDGKKCAGVLVEGRTVGNAFDSVIIGVGLNINRLDWPVELAGIATSLRAERHQGEPLDRAEVFVEALTRIEGWVRRFERDGSAIVVEALKPKLALVGDRVQWEDGTGIFQGIDEDGAAQVRTERGVETLRAAHLLPVTSDSEPLA